MPSRRRTWTNLAIGAALLGGGEWLYAQALNEPPPRPQALAPDAGGKNVIATTVAPTPTPTPPLTVRLTVPDDGLATPAKLIRAVEYHSAAEPPAAPAPARMSVELAGPASVALGEPLHYEVIVRNSGGAPACRVQVEDPLPAGLRVLQTDPPAVLRAGALIWELGTLEAGAERRLKVDLQQFDMARMPQPPRVAYTAATGLQAQVVRPAFMVALLGPETAKRGETVTFQVQLSNDGTAAIRHIVLRDQLPPGLLYPRGYVVEAEVGDLPPGQSRTIRLDAVAAQAGRFVNEVVATADGGLRVTSRSAMEVVAGPADKPSGPSSFASGR